MGERKSFLLRVDPHVHDALKRWAEDELRSLNAQAEMALREALRRAGRLPREGASEGPGAESAGSGGADIASPSGPDTASPSGPDTASPSGPEAASEPPKNTDPGAS
jgi:hypothetical protein